MTVLKPLLRKLRPLVVVSIIFLVAVFPASAGSIVNITPQAPPGVGTAMNTLLNWVYWGALVVCVIFAIIFTVQFITGGDVDAKKRAIIFAVASLVLFFLPQLLHALSSYF